ncbi:MAG: copper ion binding protein, partial [Pseudomonadota bacterium]
MAKSTFNVRGMSCAACVRRVERGLAELPGVSEASVNLAVERATVEYDPASIDSRAILLRIEELGYQGEEAALRSVSVNKTVISVGGMSCAACVGRVERLLSGIQGVTGASVNLASGHATVSHAGEAAVLPPIKRALDDAGYEFLGVVG